MAVAGVTTIVLIIKQLVTFYVIIAPLPCIKHQGILFNLPIQPFSNFQQCMYIIFQHHGSITKMLAYAW